MDRARNIALSALMLLTLWGCSTVQIGALYERPWQDREQSRDIFVTIDGTSDTLVARTNAARLYELVDSHHQRRDSSLATYYAEGVGADGNLLGLSAGLGMADDVRNAYAFLSVHYRPGDRIFLSGFSRGAYAVRALGGMIAVAGIPDLSTLRPNERKKVVSAIFKAYKTSPKSDEDRRQHFDRRVQRVREAFAKYEIEEREMANRTPIEAMAIWDTVEALGTPDGTDDPTEDVGYYLLTNCNVRAVFHALASDENRSFSFTPIFADAHHIYAPCGFGNANTKVEEVWFAGAHSDVGGSYFPNDTIEGFLPSVSFNWMLEKLKPYGIVPANAAMFADPFGPIHDAQKYSGLWSRATRQFRTPMDYQTRAGMAPKAKVHASVIARLSVAKWLDQHFVQCQPDHVLGKDEHKLICADEQAIYGLVAELQAANCLADETNPLGWRLAPGQDCIEVVGAFPSDWPEIPGRLPPNR